MRRKLKVGVIGSGRISEEYLRNMMTLFNNLEVVACSAAHMESAEKRAAQFGIEARTNEGILSDPEIDMVVVLVPAPMHAPLIEQALQAGKHVYTEKTMTVSLEDAKRLVDLANEKGLYLGSAPDTFLGAAWQTARKALDDGLIGEPISFSMNINRNLDFMASLFEFLRLPGGGFAYDYGVYYLTALVALLGPVKDLYSVVKNKAEERINCAPMSPDFGKPYRYENESQIYALMNLESGITGTVSMDGDSALQDLAYFYIYGTKGVLKLTCANDFGGDVEIVPSSFDPEEGKPKKLPNTSILTDGNRGVGPAEMADAILHGRKNRASKEMAYHVLDIISGLMESSERKQSVTVTSTCDRPAAFTDDDVRRLTKKTKSTLCVMDTETGEVKKLRTFDFLIEAPNWMQTDDDTLVFNSDGCIFKYSISQDKEEKIESGSCVNCNNDHVLSPDNEKIAVSHSQSGWMSQIYILPIGGGEPKLITPNAPSFLHGWSPDGKELAYCAFRDHGDGLEVDVYAISTEGGEERQLTANAAFNDGPEYAPNGEHIWFNSTRSGLMQCWRMNRDGSEPTQMTHSDRNNWFPHVSPDGQKVVYISYRKGDLKPAEHLPNLTVQLRMMNADGSDDRELLEFFGGQGTINVNSWSRDSKRFAFIMYDPKYPY